MAVSVLARLLDLSYVLSASVNLEPPCLIPSTTGIMSARIMPSSCDLGSAADLQRAMHLTGAARPCPRSEALTSETGLAVLGCPCDQHLHDFQCSLHVCMRSIRISAEIKFQTQNQTSFLSATSG